MAKRKKNLNLAIGMLLLSLFASTAIFADEPERVVNPQDPYEPFNRVMFRFNDFVDKFIMKPIARIYNTVLPAPIVKGISHVFSNIDNVTTVANDILQFNFYQATSDAWRVAINTTIGIGGFFDVATEMGLESNYEDLGLTFARWGWKNSNYLVLPFLGPTSVRDGIAWPIDYEYLTIYPYINPVSVRYWIYGTSLVSKRAELLRFQNVMEQAAIDRYAFLRDAYKQRRAYMIDRNQRLGDPYLQKDSEQDDLGLSDKDNSVPQS